MTPADDPTPRGAFPTTRRSVVAAIGDPDPEVRRDATNALVTAYWRPVYGHLRYRWRMQPADAEDLTQEFFARLLAKNTLGAITREKGKFRSFLLTALNHFLVDEWKKARARKRGGGQVVSLNSRDAETRFGREPVDALTPERLFEQNWALSLLDSVYGHLQREYEMDDKGALFHELKFCLAGARSSVPYAGLAARLNMPENTVKTSVHRLRQRYRELLRAEVANTVASPSEVEEELRSLFRALAGL